MTSEADRLRLEAADALSLSARCIENAADEIRRAPDGSSLVSVGHSLQLMAASLERLAGACLGGRTQ